ncbi:MAG: PilZ domain-containing protein [Piscirickettsiaceae bacterium]|nr:PilZ domain-containing protein [Piscirickettsiaceae bacterium]
MSEFNNDQREYFRINDMVFIELTPLNSSDVESLSVSIKDYSNSEENKEKSQLQTLQTAFSHLTDQINQQDREIARALRLLDEKVTLLAQSIQRQQNASENKIFTKVSLSGGGISFLSANEYMGRSAIEIRIELRSSATVIHAIANVIACEKTYDAPKETPYYLRLVFSHMSECDRNALIKHTLARQAELLRLANDN